MTTNETEIWSDNASMLDFLVNPIHWLLTLLTCGIYFVLVFLNRLNTRFTLTNERLIITKGLLSKSVDEIELFRVKDTKINQTFFSRLVKLGDIDVTSSDETGFIRLVNISNAQTRREDIRRFANEARERKGIRTIVNE